MDLVDHSAAQARCERKPGSARLTSGDAYGVLGSSTGLSPDGLVSVNIEWINRAVACVGSHHHVDGDAERPHVGCLQAVDVLADGFGRIEGRGAREGAGIPGVDGEAKIEVPAQSKGLEGAVN